MQKVIDMTAKCSTCGAEIGHTVRIDIEVEKRDYSKGKTGGRCCADVVACSNCEAIILFPYVKWEATEDELKDEAWQKEQYLRFMANLIQKYGPLVLKKQKDDKEKNK